MMERSDAWKGKPATEAALMVTIGAVTIGVVAARDDACGLDIAGTVRGEGPFGAWGCEGADVAIAVNAPGTAFRRGVLGQGRLYDDRVELDLMLEGREAQALAADLEGPGRVLLLHGEPIGERLFRVTGYEVA